LSLGAVAICPSNKWKNSGDQPSLMVLNQKKTMNATTTTNINNYFENKVISELSKLYQVLKEGSLKKI